MPSSQVTEATFPTSCLASKEQRPARLSVASDRRVVQRVHGDVGLAQPREESVEFALLAECTVFSLSVWGTVAGAKLPPLVDPCG